MVSYEGCVLIADDDLAVVKCLRRNLETRGYRVVEAQDGEAALELVERENPDMVILANSMSGVDSFEVCRRIREWSTVPIIMLGDSPDDAEKIHCLELWADDYMTKPFDKEELLARVGAVLRRAKLSRVTPEFSVFVSGNLEVNLAERRVRVGGREVKLTPIEYNLLREFVLNAGKVLTHQMLLSAVWGPEYRDEREYLRVYVGHLRRKIEACPERLEYIFTEPGVGYSFAKPQTEAVKSTL